MKKLMLGAISATMAMVAAGAASTASADTLVSCGDEYAIHTYYEFDCRFQDPPSPLGQYDLADVLVGKKCQTMKDDGSLRDCTYQWYEHWQVIAQGCNILGTYWAGNWGITTDCN